MNNVTVFILGFLAGLAVAKLVNWWNKPVVEKKIKKGGAVIVPPSDLWKGD